MSISGLLSPNTYELDIGKLNVDELTATEVDTQILKVGGSQPAGTTLVSNGTSMVNLPVGANGARLIADSGQPNGIFWKTTAYGNVQGNGSLAIALPAAGSFAEVSALTEVNSPFNVAFLNSGGRLEYTGLTTIIAKIDVSCSMTSTGGAAVTIAIVKNGVLTTAENYDNIQAAGYGTLTASAILQLAPNDQIYIGAWSAAPSAGFVVTKNITAVEMKQV